jgi:hypothetical protein
MCLAIFTNDESIAAGMILSNSVQLRAHGNKVLLRIFSTLGFNAAVEELLVLLVFASEGTHRHGVNTDHGLYMT